MIKMFLILLVVGVMANAVMLFLIWRTLFGRNVIAVKTLKQLIKMERHFTLLESILRDNTEAMRSLKDELRDNERQE